MASAESAGPPAFDPAGLGHIVAVGSGKGGVGKSTVAANLAVSMARDGARTGLLDADILGPSQGMMMGVATGTRPEMRDRMLVPMERHGVKVISFAMLLDNDDTPVVWRGPMLGKAVGQFLDQVEWGELDVLVVDLPPGTGDVQLSLAQTVPVSGAVVVTTPQDVALIDVRKAVAMFDKVRVPVLGVVENMSHLDCPECNHRIHLFGDGGGGRLAEHCGVPLLGSIPLDPAIPAGGDKGVPIAADDPDSPQARAFADLARAVSESLSAATASDGPTLPDFGGGPACADGDA